MENSGSWPALGEMALKQKEEGGSKDGGGSGDQNVPVSSSSSSSSSSAAPAPVVSMQSVAVPPSSGEKRSPAGERRVIETYDKLGGKKRGRLIQN